AELLHRSLLVDLVSSFHSDSLLFLGRKNHPRPIMTADVRVATFYELTGILSPNAKEDASTPKQDVKRPGAIAALSCFTSSFRLSLSREKYTRAYCFIDAEGLFQQSAWACHRPVTSLSGRAF